MRKFKNSTPVGQLLIYNYIRLSRAEASAPPERQRYRMNFEILGEITDVETFAIGSAIRDLLRLPKLYGRGRWRKESVKWSSSANGILLEEQ